MTGGWSWTVATGEAVDKEMCSENAGLQQPTSSMSQMKLGTTMLIDKLLYINNEYSPVLDVSNFILFLGGTTDSESTQLLSINNTTYRISYSIFSAFFSKSYIQLVNRIFLVNIQSIKHACSKFHKNLLDGFRRFRGVLYFVAGKNKSKVYQGSS